MTPETLPVPSRKMAHAITTFICASAMVTTIYAQVPGYPKPGIHAGIPFGRKQPSPSLIIADNPKAHAERLAENPFLRKEKFKSFFDFDTAYKRFLSQRTLDDVEPRLQQLPPESFLRVNQKSETLFRNFGLTRDINEVSNSYPANYTNAGPSLPFAVSKGVSYFAAEDGIHGRELWRSDGTNRGTNLLKDLIPGEASSNPTDIAAFNDKIYFNGSSTTNGSELWVSDGSSAGTKLLVDVFPGPQSSRPGQIVGAGNSIFFVTSPAINDYNYYYNAQLWRTDGTPGSALLLLDLTSTMNNAFITNSTKINDLLFFVIRRYNASTGPTTELWRSDGTTQGTFSLKVLRDFWGPMHFTAFNNKLYFSGDDGTGRKLWVSDGTSEGTVSAPLDHGISLTVYYYSSSSIPFQQIGNSILVFGSPTAGGSGLYKYDPAGTGMELVKTFVSPTDFQPPAIQSEIARLGNLVFFKFTRYSGPATHHELWVTDGTPNNTRLVKAFADGINLSNFYAYNGKIYFNIYNTYDFQLQEPWVSDGTTAGTKQLKDIYRGPASSNASSFTTVNSKLIFSARNENGTELWITNGTEAGTTIVKDINRRSTEGSNTASAGLVALGDKVVFDAYNELYGTEAYVSNGERSTFLLKDINAARGQSASPGKFLTRNNAVYFITSWYDSFRQINKIYKTDGSTRNTKQVFDPGLIDNERTAITSYNVSDNGLVYYAVYHSPSGTYNIWRTDGSIAGTYMLADNFYYDSEIAIVGNQAFFVAGKPESGFELWKSDGTKAGTTLIKDIYPGSQGSYPYSLFPFKNELYFGASDGVAHTAFWKTNGTEEGTIKLHAVTPGIYRFSGNSQAFCISNNILFFSGIDYTAIPYQGAELWRTDGTPAGTSIVKDIHTSFNSSPATLTDVNGRLFFQADDGVHGFELWTTDGSEAGTYMLTDQSPELTYPVLSMFTTAGGRLFFVNGAQGKTELWSSDGTAENTKRVTDEAINKITTISRMLGVKEKLFIAGASYQYGLELYAGTVKAKSKRLNDIEPAAVPEEIITRPFAVTLYPNPARSVATIRFNGNVANLTIIITDITGKQVMKRSFANLTQVNLPVDHLSPGIYSVSINNQSEIRTLKLIKR